MNFISNIRKDIFLIFQYTLIVKYTEKYIYGLMLAMFKQIVHNYLYNQSLELINRKQVGCCVVQKEKRMEITFDFDSTKYTINIMVKYIKLT